MTQRRLLALADILGFKKTILTTPLDVVVQTYFGYFRKAIQHTLQQQGWPDVPEDFDDLKAHARLGMEWFSDTLILYTNDDTDDAVRNLVQTVNWLLFETMYYPTVRLRVGIDYDELHVSTNAGQIVGKAVVGAHELEKQQQWSGGALTEAAAGRLTDDARHYVVEYPVPVKNPAHSSRVAVNWTQGVHLGLNIEFAASRRDPNEADRADVVEKWRNTITFHERVCVACHGR